MRNNIENMIAFYTENEEGLIDEIVVDLYEKAYFVNSGIDLRELWCIGKNSARETRVDRANYFVIKDVFESHMLSGEFFTPDDSYENRQIAQEKWKNENRSKPIIPKEKIWQAINCEVEEDELHKMISNEFRYQKDNYYNFNLLMLKIHLYLDDKISGSYFMAWCILVAQCLLSAMTCKSKKLQQVYDDIADYLDGFSFLGSEISPQKKWEESQELIAYLKYYNHEISDIVNGHTTDFLTNGVVTYVSFAFTFNDGADCAYDVCVVDKKRHAINYTKAYNIVYDEDINYTILSQPQFEGLSSEYWQDYTLDTNMSIDYAKTKII